MKTERISLTMGDAGENHAGMELVGKLMSSGTGMNIKDLDMIKIHMEKLGKKCEYIDMGGFGHDVGVLIVRNYIDGEIQKEVYDELVENPWDTKYWCTRRSMVLNKHARSNLVFLEGIEHRGGDFLHLQRLAS